MAEAFRHRAGTAAINPADILRPEVLADPYPFYSRLRMVDPVHWNEPTQAWIITRYDDVVAALHDDRLSAMGPTSFMSLLPSEVREELTWLQEFYEHWMVFSDPPYHTRVRALVQRSFAPRAVFSLTTVAETATRELLGPLDGTSSEFMSQVARPLALTVICELLRIEPDERDRVSRWSRDIISFISTSLPVPDLGRRTMVSAKELASYAGLLASRTGSSTAESNPLVAVRSLGERAVAATFAQLVTGGCDPVSCMLGNGLAALLERPDQLQRLRDDPALIPSAVEELLRFDCPFTYAPRVAKQDLELGGRPIATGDRVLLLLAAANRDPERFQDPDTLDVGRRDNRHLAFGVGDHYCIGAALARIELRGLLSVLLEQVPAITLTAPPEWNADLGVRSLARLQLFIPSRAADERR